MLAARPAEDSQDLGEAHLAHYIVFVQHSDGSIVPLYHRKAAIAGLLSLPDAKLATFVAKPGRDVEMLGVTMLSDAGQTLFQTLVEVPQWTRGEFAAQDGVSIDGHLIALEEPIFVVRVPAPERSTLVLSPLGERRQAGRVAFDSTCWQPPRPQRAWKYCSQSRPSLRRKLTQRTGLTCLSWVTATPPCSKPTLRPMLSRSPRTSSRFRRSLSMPTTSTFAPCLRPRTSLALDHHPDSSSCGYSDPSCCGDPAMLNDPLQGTMVDTAFDSHYCTNRIHRLLTANLSKLYAAAGTVPDWDRIVLVVNDPTYGGSGGSVPTAAMHSLAVQILHHEFGHSLGRLADEYESAYPGYQPCSDLSGPLCEPNVTDVVIRGQVKWNPWIQPTTPVTTPEESVWNGYVGLFEGARYQPTGMYRPGLACLMRTLGQPSCQVPSQTYVLRLYDGGWGVPAQGISLIEPGTSYPHSPFTLVHPAEQIFRAEILGPIGGPAVQITWLVNGVAVAGEHGATFSYATQPGQLGLTEITLVVKDLTALVHPSMAGDSLQSTYTWSIQVSTPTPTITPTSDSDEYAHRHTDTDLYSDRHADANSHADQHADDYVDANIDSNTIPDLFANHIPTGIASDPGGRYSTGKSLGCPARTRNNGSSWCLLRCPECGTYCDWDLQYEYLADGTEDDLVVTRLSREEGERKVRGGGRPHGRGPGTLRSRVAALLGGPTALPRSLGREQGHDLVLFGAELGQRPDAPAAAPAGGRAAAAGPRLRGRDARPDPLRPRLARPREPGIAAGGDRGGWQGAPAGASRPAEDLRERTGCRLKRDSCRAMLEMR